MKKVAVFADYIFYNGKVHNSKYLLISGEVIEGLADKEPDKNIYNITRYKNSAIFPTFINTHTHLAMSLFRGFADDLPLMEWLNNYIWKVEKRYLSHEFVYLATLLSAIEMIHSGTSTANDMYFHPDAVKSALTEAGLRGVIGFGAMGSVDVAIKGVNDFKQTDMIKASLCPHALYTVGKDNIKSLIEYANKNNLLIHTHLAETISEVELIKEKYGKTPALIIDEIGGFDTVKPATFAHCVHLTDKEIDIMGQKSVSVSHCISSNLKLASGIAPIQQFIDKGVNVSVGTDGAASNNKQSMINEIATFSKVHKAVNMNAVAVKADDAIIMATKNGAKALDMLNVGELTKGNDADFFVISFDSAMMTPIFHPTSHLVYVAESNDITDVFIKGNAIMKDRRILTLNENMIKEEARNIAKKIKL